MNSHLSSREQKVLTLALTLLILIGGFGLVAIPAPLGVSGLLAGAPEAAAATPTISGEELCAKNVILDPRLPPEKLRLEQRRYQDCVQSYNTRLTPKPMSPAVQTLVAPRTWVAPTPVFQRTPAGAGTILDYTSPAVFGPMYAIENSWVLDTQDKRYMVSAGARREEGHPQPKSATQGVVIVQVWTRSGDFLPEGGMFNVPVKNGRSVKIVSAQGQRLILKTDNGTTFYFDLPARQFVSSLTATVTPVAPTVPPYPRVRSFSSVYGATTFDNPIAPLCAQEGRLRFPAYLVDASILICYNPGVSRRRSTCDLPRSWSSTTSRISSNSFARTWKRNISK